MYTSHFSKNFKAKANKMNKLLVFTTCYLVYLVFGAAIFYFIETESSESLCEEARQFYESNKNLTININSIHDVPEVIKVSYTEL